MWQVEDRFSITIGSNKFINTPTMIEYKGESIFRVSRSENDGLLGIDFDLFSQDGTRVAKIYHGRVVDGAKDAYQFDETPLRFRVTEKSSGRVVCELTRPNDQSSELDLNVSLHMPDGFLFEATPQGTNIQSSMFLGNTFVGCGVAISISDNGMAIGGPRDGG